MALIPISTKISKYTKEEHEKTCKNIGMKKSRFIEIAILEKIQRIEMENYDNANSNKRVQPRVL